MAALRKKIAVFTAGVIATGDHSQGIPALVDAFRELSQDNDLTVYSLLRANPDHVPPGVRMRTLPFRTPYYWLDVIMLGTLLVLDHAKSRFELIHAIAGYPFGQTAVLLARLLRIPCLVLLHGGELADLPDVNFGDLRVSRRIKKLKMTCERADALVTLSRFQALGLSALGIAPNRATVIPFGVDTPHFPYEEKPLNAPYQFVHVSYAQPVKDVTTLLKTFAIINANVDSRLVIIGRNHIGQETQRLVDEYSITSSVELVGTVPNKQIAEYLGRAHFLLLTSRYESQAVVLSEAMSAGVVVCATRVGLAFDLGDEYCITADTGDAGELADKVLAVMNDVERYATLRARALRWCEIHDVKWTAAQYRKIYDRL